jgi:hypothetical protein
MIDNFIGVYDNALSNEDCDNIIAYFNELDNINLAFTRQELKDADPHIKDDRTVFPMSPREIMLRQTTPLLNGFMSSFVNCWDKYLNRYSMLKLGSKFQVQSIRIQNTPIGGGYHTWHWESNNYNTSPRFISFMAYLNDVEEGGETEFLYMQKRYKPNKGQLLIWPSGFTHTHRGNPPLSNDKWIITGWLHFTE